MCVCSPATTHGVSSRATMAIMVGHIMLDAHLKPSNRSLVHPVLRLNLTFRLWCEFRPITRASYA